MRPTA
jgi:hypothetical protein